MPHPIGMHMHMHIYAYTHMCTCPCDVVQVAEEGGVPPLVALLNEPRAEHENATQALWHLGVKRRTERRSPKSYRMHIHTVL